MIHPPKNYLIYDAETNICNQSKFSELVVGKNKASPFHPDNGIHMHGWLFSEDKGCKDAGTSCTELEESSTEGFGLEGTELLVGQNIKFDIHHLLTGEHAYFLDWFKEGGKIWDTMLAEYILTFQQSKWASLDSLAEKYGGTLKDDRIKDFWENGIDTPDIPQDMLEEYLIGDIDNTHIVFKAQYEKAQELGMLPLIESQMDALLMTTLMELSGMEFDKKKSEGIANDLLSIFTKQLDDVVDLIRSDHRSAYSHLPLELAINPLSTQHLSAILFGGVVKYRERFEILDEDGEPVVYKSGKKKGEVKTKWGDSHYTFPAKYSPKNPIGKSGYYPVGDEVLSQYKGDTLCQAVLELRDLRKQISTYFEGYAKLVWPDGKIHGSLNHCQTETGRLSSSNPNLQNVSGKSTEV